QQPNDGAFAGLDRRALTFRRGTLGGYTRFRYCPLALALPESNGARNVIHRSQKQQLPVWLRHLGWRLKQKATVRKTRGTDGESLVVLVHPNDYQMMIRVFMAMK